ncbi:hypothetical protein PFISCL1PPCAC_1591 [Pristionchus fissidentatus]|uniref:Uncharacterized protein n=2 Tax=Pristionchus fissidentatus TaxID=1538716 RepID=A0AAV5UTC3_9BILA|nr:hypothetical protein PFISCL1PPCAC_1591 [Pristionchus fissidentatus]
MREERREKGENSERSQTGHESAVLLKETGEKGESPVELKQEVVNESQNEQKPAEDPLKEGIPSEKSVGRKRLEEVIQERKRSIGRMKSKKSEKVSKKKKTPVAKTPVDSTKESTEDPPPFEKKSTSVRNALTMNIPKKPTDPRQCVHPRYLSLYDEMIEEEKKEHDRELRKKYTIRFLLIGGCIGSFFIGATIALAVLHFSGDKKCRN